MLRNHTEGALALVRDNVPKTPGDTYPLDADTLLSTANAVAVGVVAVSTVLSVGLWLLFARLLDQGRARTAGLWLGAVNGIGLLLGVVGAVGLLEAALSLLSLGLVVAGLVLLWSPVTAAWFRAVAATRSTPTPG